MDYNSYLESNTRQPNVAKEIAEEIEKTPKEEETFFKTVLRKVYDTASIFKFAKLLSMAYDVFSFTRIGSDKFVNHPLFQTLVNKKIIEYYETIRKCFVRAEEIYKEHSKKISKNMPRAEHDKLHEEYVHRIKKEVLERIGYDPHGPYRDFINVVARNILPFIKRNGRGATEWLIKNFPDGMKKITYTL